ncbi:MAG: hypothetical protein V1733_07530 [bacterium]
MNKAIWITLAILGSTLRLTSQEPEWVTKPDQVNLFLNRQDKLFETYSVALGDAYYDYYSGVLKDAGKLELLKADPYVQKDSMETVFRTWMPKRGEITDTLFHRRMIQWIQILSMAQVNDIPELRNLQSELEKWLITPDSVQGKPPADSLEALTKELLVKRNAWARGLGYPGYRELVLMVSGIRPEDLHNYLNLIDQLTLPAYQELVEQMKKEKGLQEVSIRDIFGIYSNYFQSSPPEPSTVSRQEILSSTLNRLGIHYGELPILHREMQLPPPMGGQGIAVRIPDNFKLVVNPGVGLSTIFHEVGHGLACVYNQMPSAVLKGYEWVEGGDTPVMSEGLAEWSAAIVQNPEWMKKYTDLSDEEIAEKQKTRKTYAPVNLRFWLYNVWLELEIFNDPEQNLDTLRKTFMKRFLLVDKPSSRPVTLANSMYVSYPVYNHNYLLGGIIAWQIHTELEKRLGPNYLFNPETAALMQQYFYKDGEYYHWLERLGRFTGKVLDIEGYVEWLQGK